MIRVTRIDNSDAIDDLYAHNIICYKCNDVISAGTKVVYQIEDTLCDWEEWPRTCTYYLCSKHFADAKPRIMKLQEQKPSLKIEWINFANVDKYTPVSIKDVKDDYALSISSDGQRQFTHYWNIISAEIHDWAERKKFWEPGVSRNDSELLCLMHSEISEALEALRHGNPPDDKIPEFKGTEAELADLIIRVMDTAYARGWRLPEAIFAKMKYNNSRPIKHGKKF